MVDPPMRDTVAGELVPGPSLVTLAEVLCPVMRRCVVASPVDGCAAVEDRVSDGRVVP